MNNTPVRLSAWSGIAAGLVAALAIPLYFVHSGPPPAANVLTRILLNLLTCGLLLLFFTGLRDRLRRADPGREWLSGLVHASALIYLTVTLTAASLEAGTVLADPGGSVDPTVDGPLAHGAMLLHGSVARLVTAVLLFAAGYAILRSGALPRWTGVSAYAVAGINAAFLPSLYFGTDAADFYSAVGWGNSALTASRIVYWALAAGIAQLRVAARERHAYA